MSSHWFLTYMLIVSILVGSLELKASCCSSASSNGIGRLLSYERAYLEFFNDARYAIGSFNSHAKFRAGILNHLPHLQLSHELHAMVRLADFLEPFVKIPMKMSISLEKTQSRLGDITLGARWPLFGEGFVAHMPALSLVSSVQIPTSVEPYWLSAGLVLDKSFGALNLSLSYGLSLDPAYFSKQPYRRGIKHVGGLQAGFLLAESHRLSFGCALNFQNSAVANNKALSNSKYQVGFNALYSWAFHSHLTFTSGLGAHIPVSHLGKNANSEIFAQAGLRVRNFLMKLLNILLLGLSILCASCQSAWQLKPHKIGQKLKRT